MPDFRRQAGASYAQAEGYGAGGEWVHSTFDAHPDEPPADEGNFFMEGGPGDAVGDGGAGGDGAEGAGGEAGAAADQEDWGGGMLLTDVQFDSNLGLDVPMDLEEDEQIQIQDQDLGRDPAGEVGGELAASEQQQQLPAGGAPGADGDGTPAAVPGGATDQDPGSGIGGAGLDAAADGSPLTASPGDGAAPGVGVEGEPGAGHPPRDGKDVGDALPSGSGGAGSAAKPERGPSQQDGDGTAALKDEEHKPGGVAEKAQQGSAPTVQAGEGGLAAAAGRAGKSPSNLAARFGRGRASAAQPGEGGGTGAAGGPVGSAMGSCAAEAGQQWGGGGRGGGGMGAADPMAGYHSMALSLVRVEADEYSRQAAIEFYGC